MKRIPKWAKRLLLIAVVAAVVGAGGYLIYQGNFGSAVSVYVIDDNISTEQNWNISTSALGTVKSSGTQSVTISETQTVGKTMVKEGDTVKKGDALFSYDSTLADIQMERQNITIKQLNMQLSDANKQLKTLRSYKPGVPINIDDLPSGAVPTSNKDTTNSVEAKNASASTGMQVVLLGAGDTSVPGQNATEQNGASDPATGETGGTGGAAGTDGTDGTDASTVTFTRSELNTMIQEKKNEIRDLDLQLRQAKLEYKKLENEMDNTTVYSKLDGVVSYIGNPSDKSKPYIKITAAGGNTIQTVVDEWSIDKIKVGQGASITDWMHGEELSGTVRSIGTYPASDFAYEGYTTNSSYYPVLIEVSGNLDLNEDDYVDVTFDAAEEDSDSFYLQASFILTEGKQKYVYVRGEDNLLHKTQVKVGANMDGYYQEILDGVQLGDWIAFPYGKNVKDGAKTVEADISDLW